MKKMAGLFCMILLLCSINILHGQGTIKPNLPPPAPATAPKPAPKPAAPKPAPIKPPSASSSVPVEKASVAVTWSGNNTVKIIIGKLEAAFSPGQTKTLQLPVDELLNISVVSVTQSYNGNDFLLLEKGESFLDIHLSDQEEFVEFKLETKAARDAAALRKKLADEERTRTQQQLIKDYFKQNMILIQGGTYTMGCTPEQGSGCDAKSSPAHSQSVNSFYMSKYEVTQALWDAVNDRESDQYANYPASSEYQEDVLAFIHKLDSITGKKYRLPTEAEWEFAARGGNISKGYLYSGSNDINAVAWHNGNSSSFHPVGLKQPNELGLYDMSGNLWEWCSDVLGYEESRLFWSENYKGPKVNPIEELKVLRGGSCSEAAAQCIISSRTKGKMYHPPPTVTMLYIMDGSDVSCQGKGFRLVMDPEEDVARQLAEAEKQALAAEQQGDQFMKEGNYQQALEAYGRSLQHVNKLTVSAKKISAEDALALRQKLQSVNPRLKELMGSYAEMVYIPGGTFTMGCTSEQGDDCYSDESPSHRVTLSSYSIGKYEVTQAQWRTVMGANPGYFSGCDLCPVEQVSWEDVQEFIRKLNNLTGKDFRLPTEAEWEYAARGGSSSRGYMYAGGNDIGSVAWYYGNCGEKTHPVGQKAANELGLYDMSGNVWEWCSDWYGAYSNGSQTDPVGPSSGTYRVFRGGCWDNARQPCRMSNRGGNISSYRYNGLGFRLVLAP